MAGSDWIGRLIAVVRLNTFFVVLAVPLALLVCVVMIFVFK
jgi:hypothetical protein